MFKPMGILLLTEQGIKNKILVIYVILHFIMMRDRATSYKEYSTVLREKITKVLLSLMRVLMPLSEAETTESLVSWDGVMRQVCHWP